MKEAQTFVLDESGILHTYQNEWHTDNHYDHIEKNCKNLVVNEYIPILLARNGNCVLDLSESRKLCEVYLPQSITEKQKEWLLGKEKHLQEFHLGIYSIHTSEESWIREWEQFETLKEEINRKKVKEKKI